MQVKTRRTCQRLRPAACRGCRCMQGLPGPGTCKTLGPPRSEGATRLADRLLQEWPKSAPTRAVHGGSGLEGFAHGVQHVPDVLARGFLALDSGRLVGSLVGIGLFHGGGSFLSQRRTVRYEVGAQPASRSVQFPWWWSFGVGRVRRGPAPLGVTPRRPWRGYR